MVEGLLGVADGPGLLDLLGVFRPGGARPRTLQLLGQRASRICRRPVMSPASSSRSVWLRASLENRRLALAPFFASRAASSSDIAAPSIRFSIARRDRHRPFRSCAKNAVSINSGGRRSEQDWGRRAHAAHVPLALDPWPCLARIIATPRGALADAPGEVGARRPGDGHP